VRSHKIDKPSLQEDKIVQGGESVMKEKPILGIMILLLLSLTALSDSEMEVRKK
jgi:hypothetical protein